MKIIRISALIITLALVFTACSSGKSSQPLQPFDKDDVSGTWESTGLADKGLQVKIEKQGSDYKSSVVKLESKNDAALKVGDEKWQQIKKDSADRTWKMKDLFSNRENKPVLLDSNMKLSEDGKTLEVNLLGKTGDKAGVSQYWVRK